VEKLRDFGLISGDENGRFNPTDNATRAELAKIASQLDPLVFYNDRFKRNPFNKIFGYSEEDAPLPYRIYIPEDYDESKEYPLLIFLHGNSAQGNDNEKHYGIVKYAFLSPYSPVYDSIVVVPQCPEGLWWHDSKGTIDMLADLMDYINERYSTDSTRQYVSGISMGGQGSWEMAIHRPEKVSAIMPVAGVGYGFHSGLEGAESIIDLNPDMLDVNIRMIYDNDDGYSPGWYNRQLYAALIDAGATNITYYETQGLGHDVCGEYAGYYNTSHLDWLYAQRRETVGPSSNK
jgi:predicted peptidase